MWLVALGAELGACLAVRGEPSLTVARVCSRTKGMGKSHRIPPLKWILRYGRRYGWHLTH